MLNIFTDKLVGISLCNGKQCIYIPINHINSTYHVKEENQIPEKDIKEIFGKVFKDRVFKYVYHNAKFDLAVLRTFFGYQLPNPYWDTMIAGNLMNQDEDHNLKYLYNKYIAVEDEGVNRFDTLFKGITFDYVPLDVATIYAGKDAFMTLELFDYQQKMFNTPDFKGLKYVMEEIEMPLLPILEDMQRTGVNMNMGMLNELYKKYSARLEQAKLDVYAEINKHKEEIDTFRVQNYKVKLDNPINIASPAQLSVLFYQILGYKTKSGKGTGVDELKEINTPLTKALLEYRAMSKMIDAFLVALPKRIEPSTGKIHTSLNQYGAATGRFSSSNPNLQQIPSRGEGKEIRRIFGAGPGNILMSSDFSQQEPRCLASLADDPKMREAYLTGKDLYATMAAEIYKMPYEDCMEFYLDENGKKTDKTNPEGKKRRSATKSILLGILYGRGTASVAEQTGMTVEEAQQVIDDFFNAYPAIKQFTEITQENAKKNGYTTTAWGRRRYLKHIQDELYTYKYNKNRKVDFNPLFTAESVVNKEVPQDIKDKYNDMLQYANYYQKKKIIDQAEKDGVDITENSKNIADALRQCVNSTIQGSAADMSKKAMILLGTNQELKDLGFKMLFPVHDEVIAECPEENVKECSRLLADTMSKAAEKILEMPIGCDVEITKAWYGEKIDI